MPDPRAPMHPQIEMLFGLMSANRSSRVLEAGALREGMAALAPMLAAGAPEVTRREIHIPSADGELRALVFSPDVGAEPAPVLLYFHGGGYVMMSPDTHAKLTAQLAQGAGAVIVSVDYRLSPEHRFPVPQEDCLAAFRWVRAHAGDLGGDPRRVGVAGDSAGGNAAAATCLRALAAGEAPPEAALLICPWLDMALDTGSLATLGPDDPLIDTTIMEFFRDAFVGRDQIEDPLASPLRADLSRFPRTLVVLGGIDPLHDEGLAFARKLEESGRQVEILDYPGMPHIFMLFPGIDEGEKSVAAMCAFLGQAL